MGHAKSQKKRSLITFRSAPNDIDSNGLDGNFGQRELDRVVAFAVRDSNFSLAE